MNQSDKALTSEELIKYIQIIINDNGPYGLLEALEIANRDDIFTKIKSSLSLQEVSAKTQYTDIDQVLGCTSETKKEDNKKSVELEEPHVTSIDSASEASIYAKEHIDDVREDFMTHTGQNFPEESPVTLDSPKILEKKLPPNNYGDSETVVPGQFTRTLK